MSELLSGWTALPNLHPALPGVFDDVVVTATVDLSRFDGVFGLGHHVHSIEDGVLFTLSSSGEAEHWKKRITCLLREQGSSARETPVAGKTLATKNEWRNR